MDTTNFNRGEGEMEFEEDPFQRSSRVTRSPSGQQTKPQRSVSECEPQSPIVDLTEEPASDKDESHFLKLGRGIKALVEMLEENGGKRRSIHQPMRDTIESIKSLYELVAIQQRDGRAKEVIRRNTSSQTTPGLRLQTKRRQVSTSDTAETPDPKRKQKQMTAPKPRMKNVNDVHTPVNRSAQPSGARQQNSDEGGEGWTKVSKKKATKRSREPRKPRTRPDAILIGTKGDMSYADILRSVKSDPKLAAIGNVVSRIRRTQKGELLLQLNEAGAKTTEAQKSISEVLGTNAEVKTLTHRMTIECKDIDEVTTKEEICTAIREQFGIEEKALTEAISLRETFGHTQTALISLPAESAKKLLDASRIKIGWVVCRIRERAKITKCFKCLEFGHLAKFCRNGVDRSKLCRSCGNEGHIAKHCKEEPSCMFCRGDRTQDAKHIAGSNKCPVFRRALNSRR